MSDYQKMIAKERDACWKEFDIEMDPKRIKDRIELALHRAYQRGWEDHREAVARAMDIRNG